MNVGEMQRKLSSWAVQEKEHQFFDLYHLLYDKGWLRLAHDYVKQNAGSITAGCDGINMNAFDENLEDNLQRLAQELKTETFEPQPVRRVYIPKPGGKVRPLGIPSIKDRIVQEALRMVLEPIYEADFSQNSFGFRPNRRTMDAIKYLAVNTLGNKPFYWVIEGDISSYFDTINHRRLVKILRRRIRDEKVLRLVARFLRAGVMEGKLFKDTKQGTPQGGIISPLLANIYLHELDKYMERYTELSEYERKKRRANGQANFVYARYADDFVVLCNGTKEQAEAMKEELTTVLQDALKLELSKEKTKITHLNDGFDFLGFTIRRCLGTKGMATKILIPKKAVDRLCGKITHVTSQTTHQDSFVSKIVSLNHLVRGWCQYYQYASNTSIPFRKVRYQLYWRMAHWIGTKHRRSVKEVIRQYGENNSFVYEGYRLTMPDEFPTKRYMASVRKPNPYTMQEIKPEREELLQDNYWTGYERRRGMADLRPLVLERDGFTCQLCDRTVESRTAEVDHVKPVKRFKRPVDANSLDNLWTLCIPCHSEKTKSDRQMESRMP